MRSLKLFTLQDEDGLLAWWRTVEGMLDLKFGRFIGDPVVVFSF